MCKKQTDKIKHKTKQKNPCTQILHLSQKLTHSNETLSRDRKKILKSSSDKMHIIYDRIKMISEFINNTWGMN